MWEHLTMLMLCLCYAYAMLCFAMPCYSMLCYAMLCLAIVCCAMLCHAIYYTMLSLGFCFTWCLSWSNTSFIKYVPYHFITCVTMLMKQQHNTTQFCRIFETLTSISP